MQSASALVNAIQRIFNRAEFRPTQRNAPYTERRELSSLRCIIYLTKERIRGATLSETRTAKTSSNTFCTVDTNTLTHEPCVFIYFFPPQVLREYAHIIVPRHSPHPFEVEACTLRDPSRVRHCVLKLCVSVPSTAVHMHFLVAAT